MNKTENSSKKNIGEVFQKYGYVLVLALFAMILSTLSPYFLTVSNFINIARQVSINFILAVGATVVIISAGIDLSVGSILAFSGVVGALYLNTGGNFIVAILIALALGTLLGVINGFFIAKMKLAPFIATLGMMSVARGLALVVTGGNAITIDVPNYVFLGSGVIFGIPVPVIIAGLIFLLGAFLLSKTWIGKYIYAIGGNKEASRLSGIEVDKMLIFTYGLSGFLAGLAAVVLSARLWAAPPIMGEGYELQAIAAAVIGGASLSGGEGFLTGTLYGAFVIGIIRNGLNLIGVSSFWQQVAIGSIIILAVLVDQIKKRK